MHFGFMTLLKMNKNGYHLEILFDFPFPRNGFPSKCFKKPAILGIDLFFLQINRNIFFKQYLF